MKSIARCIIFVCLISGCATVDTKEILRNVPNPTTFVPPKPDEFVLSNGMRVFFLEDKELPLIRGTLYIRGGSLWETPAKTSSFGALGSLMRSGGAGSRSADELDKALEAMSANVTTSFGSEYGAMSFGCLSGDLSKVLSIFSDVLFRPRFQNDRISLWKSQMLEGIRRRKDSPDSVAPIAFNQLVFGDSPLGRVVTNRSVRRVNQSGLRSLHREFIRPDGALLAVSGSIQKEKLKSLLEKTFASWRPAGTMHTPPKFEIRSARAGIYFLRLPFTQATLLAGHVGVPRLSKDYIEIEGFNTLFGSDGDFSSYLARIVRSDMGLAYSVIGGIYAGFPVGKQMIALQTKSDSTGDALLASLAVLDRMQNQKFTQEEVEDVKRSIGNSYIFKFDTLDGLVARRALLTLLNYPKTYDDTYAGRISSLTAPAISDVAVRRWNVSSLIILVAGDDAAYRSLKQSINSGPSYLKALPMHEVYFDEALRLQ